MSMYSKGSRFLKRSVPFLVLFSVSCKKTVFQDEALAYQFGEVFALSKPAIVCRDGVFKAYKDSVNSLAELGIDQLVVLHSKTLTASTLAYLYSQNTVDELAAKNIQHYVIDAGSEREAALASGNGLDLEVLAASAKSFSEMGDHAVILASKKGTLGLAYSCTSDGGAIIFDYSSDTEEPIDDNDDSSSDSL
jgi:hypothetical protein